MRSRPRFQGHSLLLLALATAGACSSPNIEAAGGGRSGGAPGGGTGAGGRGGGNNPGGGAGNPGGGAQPPTPLPPADPGMQPPPNPPGGGVGEESCTATSAMAMPGPVDLYILQDKSISMAEPAAGMLTKWDAVKRALTTFLEAPSTAGMNVGLGLFPVDAKPPSAACLMCRDLACLTQCGCMGVRCTSPTMCTCGAWSTRVSCVTGDYVQPVIPVEPLPAAGARIVAALNQATLTGGTPTGPAFEGALQYARMHQMTTGRRIAIALATDGEPTGCLSPNSVAGVSELARTAAMSGINTFVIGVGPALMNLNAIAAAGGTNQAFLVETGSVDTLIAALKAIQTQASKLACSFTIPPPPMGQMLDPNKVNVSFAPTGAAPNAATHIPRVANRAACGPMGGWYYDNPMMPAQVNLCEASCNKVNSSANAQVSLLFGCKTTVIE